MPLYILIGILVIVGLCVYLLRQFRRKPKPNLLGYTKYMGTRAKKRPKRRRRNGSITEVPTATVVPVVNLDNDSFSTGVRVGDIVIDTSDGHVGISAGGIGIDPF